VDNHHLIRHDGLVPTRLAVAAFAALFTLHASPALGDSTGPAAVRLPVAEAERPLTLPALILSPTLDANATHWPEGTFGNLTLGAALGVTDDLELDAEVLPVQLASPAGYGGIHYGETSNYRGPRVGATFRLLRGTVEIGASFHLTVLTDTGRSGVALEPGVPVYIHLLKDLRLETGAALQVTLQSASTGTAMMNPGTVYETSVAKNDVDLTIPVDLLWSVTEAFHAGLNTGFRITDLSTAGASSVIPLGATLGYTVGGRHGPLVDIDPFFTFPGLFAPGATQKTDTSWYVAGITVAGYLYL
jgi:hypothetical protein